VFHLVPACPGSPGQRAVKRLLCVVCNSLTPFWLFNVNELMSKTISKIPSGKDLPAAILDVVFTRGFQCA